jgi:hypothetical protein
VTHAPKNATHCLTCCARCNGFLTVEWQMMPSERSGAWVYCKKCRAIVEAEQAGRPCVKGSRCVHVDYQRGPFADLVVLEVRDDEVRVMVLGFPDGLPAGAYEFNHRLTREWFTRGELLMIGN